MQVVLDPDVGAERRAAFADFVAHDVPDFSAWCDAVCRRAGHLNGAEVRLVSSQDDLRANIEGACALTRIWDGTNDAYNFHSTRGKSGEVHVAEIALRPVRAD